VLLVCVALLLAAKGVWAAAPGAGFERIIVKLRSGRVPEPAGSSASSTPAVTAALARRARLSLRAARSIGAGMQLIEVTPQISGESVAEVLARLRADPAVQYADLDMRRYPQAIPNDLLYPRQWYLQAPTGATPSAVDAERAWETSTGSEGIVIAELDTGVRFDHPDLLRAGQGGRLLPGYNFISNAEVANDGDGRDADASDPGDWVTSTDTEAAPFIGCKVQDSSWHGTQVAGVLGAITNNQAGVAGLTWQGWILPVRVLGKCGGYDSDILPAMLWAAGIHVNGVPDNPYPAQIENLSFGSAGSCAQDYADVISQLTAKGVLVVASAGNDSGPVDSPADCAGVAGIAALTAVGTKVGYSNLGPQIALSAPGGNCGNTGGTCLYPIVTTTNFGTTVPGDNGYTGDSDPLLGTSFATPIVAGIAALMKSVNGNLDPAELMARLESSATPFPPSPDPSLPVCQVPGAGTTELECGCTNVTCGAGMVNAPRAMEEALRPIAAIALPPAVSPGQTLTLDGSGSAAACGHSIASFAWTETGSSAVISNAATVALTAPASGTVTLRLTVTDDAGRTDAARATIGPNEVTSDAPARAGSTACLRPLQLASAHAAPASAAAPALGGGGGSMDALTLIALAAAGIGRLQRSAAAA
jgi:serine protease